MFAEGSIQPMELIGTLCFAGAIIHTFLVSRFQKMAHRYPEGSVMENLLHLVGEVEISFGFWAGLYLCALAISNGSDQAMRYLDGLSLTEPMLVFVIMVVCATKPILSAAQSILNTISRLLPLSPPIAVFITTLSVGPLLGSFITEPAAMTVTTLLLLDRFFKQKISMRFKYAILGLLFVNVSIGGTLTPFAAPPVLMVSAKWNWDLSFMLSHFGWRAVLVTVISSSLTAWFFRDELRKLAPSFKKESQRSVPYWIIGLHLLFLFMIVASHHHPKVFIGFFLFFLGLYTVTTEYQEPLRLREGLLVTFFLGGIVVLGEPQRWWLEALLQRLDNMALYSGAIALTSITDNAALAYLGSQIETLSDTAKYLLISGCVVGGGLTVIANAPNPVGYGLLNSSFGEDGIKPLYLALAALPTTLLAAFIFWAY